MSSSVLYHWTCFSPAETLSDLSVHFILARVNKDKDMQKTNVKDLRKKISLDLTLKRIPFHLRKQRGSSYCQQSHVIRSICKRLISSLKFARQCRDWYQDRREGTSPYFSLGSVAEIRRFENLTFSDTSNGDLYFSFFFFFFLDFGTMVSILRGTQSPFWSSSSTFKRLVITFTRGVTPFAPIFSHLEFWSRINMRLFISFQR